MRKAVVASAEWKAGWARRWATWLPAPPGECSPEEPMGTEWAKGWVKQIIEASGKRQQQ